MVCVIGAGREDKVRRSLKGIGQTGSKPKITFRAKKDKGESTGYWF